MKTKSANTNGSLKKRSYAWKESEDRRALREEVERLKIVYQTCQRTDSKTSIDHLSRNDKKQILDLREEIGSHWIEIGEILNIDKNVCKYYYFKGDWKKGEEIKLNHHWTKEEDRKLKKTIKKVMQVEDAKSVPSCKIPWKKVAENMGKLPDQCYRRWKYRYPQVVKRLPTYSGELTKARRYLKREDSNMAQEIETLDL